MKLKIIGSSSAGNCYLLESSSGEVLMIECGVRFDEIKKALDFNLKKVVGCLVSHSHGDHCKSIGEVLTAGIKVHASPEEHEVMRTIDHYNSRSVIEHCPFAIGQFRIIAFAILHDTPNPLGFMINHEESGTILFLTDSIYSPFKFKGLNQVIIEANYCEDIIDRKVKEGGNKFVRDRVIQSHLSIQTCKQLLSANNLSKVNNICLIHLSDNNSDAARFQKEVKELTGKNVVVADKGMEIDFNLTPF